MLEDKYHVGENLDELVTASDDNANVEVTKYSETSYQQVQPEPDTSRDSVLTQETSSSFTYAATYNRTESDNTEEQFQALVREQQQQSGGGTTQVTEVRSTTLRMNHASSDGCCPLLLSFLLRVSYIVLDALRDSHRAYACPSAAHMLEHNLASTSVMISFRPLANTIIMKMTSTIRTNSNFACRTRTLCLNLNALGIGHRQPHHFSQDFTECQRKILMDLILSSSCRARSLEARLL